MHNQPYRPDEHGIKLRYYTIVAKLQATIAEYKSLFPHLAVLETLMSQLQGESESDADYLQRLRELCAHLQELSVNSHAIRHLHYNLCSDVEAVENKNFKINKESYYITLPK